MTSADERTPAPRQSVPWRALGLLAVVLLVMVTGGIFRAELQGGLRELEQVVRGAGWAGPLVYVAIYVAWTVACLPGSLITVAGGSLFAHSPVVAVAAVSAGSTLGAGACFLIARHVARDAIRRWVGESGLLATLDRATERHGVWFVAVSRLTPIFPFNLLNYAFGLTRIRFWPYLAVSWIAMLPATLVYVLGASAITQGLRDGRVPWGLVGGLAVGLTLAMGVGLVARRRWRAATTKSENASGEDGSGSRAGSSESADA